MKVLDLFAGLKGWSQPFMDRGHEVFTVDYDTIFDVDLHKDIRDLTLQDLPWHPDIVLISPPCEKFSVMTIGRNWNLDNTPKNQDAADAATLVQSALKLVEEIHPRFWVMENPRAKLRKLDFMQEYERLTVTYCQYGDKFMKPTDLWGEFPVSFVTKPICKNGAPCHVAAMRGSKTGIQGDNKTKFHNTEERQREVKALRAKIPYELALSVCLAAEEDIEADSEIYTNI